ncbi:MAG TPA: hypothetical protein VGM19_04900 [Armatimonadota bacterium]|jgi:hypothetical protein
MNYTVILSRAWQITRQYRFIWWLGLLAMFTEGAGGPGGVNFPHGGGGGGGSSSQEKSSPGNHLNSTTYLGLQAWEALRGGQLPRMQPSFGDNEKWGRFLHQGWEKARPYAGLAAVGGLVLLLLLLVLIYYSLAAKAGLILSVQALEEQAVALGFTGAMAAGGRYVWRLFGMSLLLGLAVLGALTIMALPVVALAIVGAHGATAAVVGAVVLGIGCLLVLIVISLYVAVLEKLASRRLVLSNGGIMESLSGTNGLIRARLGPAALTWLVSVAVGIGYSVALTLAVVVLLVPLVLVGVGVYAAAKTAGTIIFGVLVGLALLVVLFIIGGVFTGFMSSYWTLAYRELERLRQPVVSPPGRGPWDRPVGVKG